MSNSIEKIWLKEKLYQLALWLACTVFGTLGLIYSLVYHRSPGDDVAPGDLVGFIITAPTSFFGLVVTGLMMFIAGIGIFKTITTIGRLSIGPPKAGKTPEATTHLFFSSVAVASGSLNLGWVRPDAMFALTPAAANGIGGWEGLQEYWTEQNGRLLEHLQRLVAPAPITQTRFEVGQVSKVGADTADTARRQVEMQYTVISGENSSFSSAQTLGPWLFNPVCELKKQDDRWYVADPRMCIVPEATSL